MLRLHGLRHIHELAILLSCLSLILLPQAVGAQVPYNVTISVRGLPTGIATTLYVDGSSNRTLASNKPVTLNFASSGLVHVVTVDFYVPNSVGDKGVRYFDNSPSWTFSGPGNHTFTYVAQYLLTLQTPYSTASGGGWYDAGVVARAVLANGQVDEGQGTRLAFTGWSGDASGRNLTSDNIIIDSPKTALAVWKTQFLLTINSDPPAASEFQGGWYDSGAQATFSVPTVTQVKDDSRLRFSAWTGDYSGQSPRGSIMMDRPRVVTAHFIAQYLLTVQYDPQSIASHYNETHAGWYDSGSAVQLGPAPTLIDISSVERLRFTNWVDNGQSIDNFLFSVTVNRAHKISLIYATQYYVDVTTSHGSVGGSGWYDSGANAKITEVEDNSWLVSYNFAGWNVNPPGKLTRSDDSWSLIVDRPYTVQAVWNVNYLPLIALFGGGSLAAAILAASVLLVKKRHASPTEKSEGGQICRVCGGSMPEGAVYCLKCGTSLVASPSEASLEEKVYDYVIKHEGVISLSKAASDLGMTVEQVKAVTEKLKAEGRLS